MDSALGTLSVARRVGRRALVKLSRSPLKLSNAIGVERAMNRLSEPVAVYVHIPFCLSKCNYCDFNTYEGIEPLMPSFVDALSSEIGLWGTRLSRPDVSTVFFGGGTPSYLPAESITLLSERLREATNIVPGAEITLEANPDDVNAEKVDAWLEAGFNRISIGVQSFDNQILHALSRRHDSDQAISAVATARSAGFKNISIDLMFGLPNQSLTVWEDSLKRAIELETDHLSLYGLQIEPGTPLQRDVERGTVPTPDNDLAADMYEMAMDYLSDAGYEHYEISNWCKPGFRSRHNLAYWLNQPYLGVGPGAHSSMMDRRFANMKSPRRYISAIVSASVSDEVVGAPVEQGEIAVDFVEVTSFEMAMSETMMLGMRLSEGMAKSEFQRRFGISMSGVYGQEISKLASTGLIEDDGDRIRLTRHGKLLGNNVFESFIITGD